MNSLDRTRSVDVGEVPLVDLPLRGVGADALTSPLFGPALVSTPAAPAWVAPLSTRARAFAADGAMLVLLVSLCVLLASNLRGQPLRPAALPWAIAFAVYLSFFTTVVPLVLFGRTVGMALAGLSARAPGSERLSSREGLLRWSGTVLAAAALGLPLLWTARRPEEPTPADRFSGRPLVESETIEGA